MKAHTIPASVPPMSVYRYIRRAWPLLSDHRIREAFQKKDVRINGRRVTRGESIMGGDTLSIYLPDSLFQYDINVLFDDGHLLVVEKPIGLPVDADHNGVGEDTVLARVRDKHSSASLCHRLDTDTGGTMLISLNEGMRQALSSAFKAGEVKKTYRAIVIGAIAQKGSFREFLVKDADAGKVRIVHKNAPGARHVRTDYTLIGGDTRQGTELSYVEIDLKTGRTHQIRAHFASVGYPLLGDDKYGDRAANRLLKTFSPCLWCVGLEIDAGCALNAYQGMRFESPDPYMEEMCIK